MRQKWLLVLMIGCTFFFPKHLLGQGCGVVMTYHYSSYAATSADASHIYTSVVVDGSGTCENTIECNCSAAIHTPKAYNKIGSAGGWTTFNSTCPACYFSDSNNESIVATPGVVYPFLNQAQVLCSFAGTVFSSNSGSNEVQSQNCGSAKGEVLDIVALPQSNKCDGTTKYTAGMGIGGSGDVNITSTSASTSTDNVLVLDLLNGPYKNPLCPNKAGSNWCYEQDYKAYSYPKSPTGNINWRVKIWCGAKLNPDIDQPVSQPFSCQ